MFSIIIYSYYCFSFLCLFQFHWLHRLLCTASLTSYDVVRCCSCSPVTIVFSPSLVHSFEVLDAAEGMVNFSFLASMPGGFRSLWQDEFPETFWPSFLCRMAATWWFDMPGWRLPMIKAAWHSTSREPKIWKTLLPLLLLISLLIETLLPKSLSKCYTLNQRRLSCGSRQPMAQAGRWCGHPPEGPNAWLWNWSPELEINDIDWWPCGARCESL